MNSIVLSIFAETAAQGRMLQIDKRVPFSIKDHPEGPRAIDVQVAL
jgi:hypothetical protein